jgi:hypothetical protein
VLSGDILGKSKALDLAMITDAQSAANKNALLTAVHPNAELNNLGEGSAESKWIESLNDYDLADCVLKATVRGNELLVRTLMERRGPIPIHFESKSPDVIKCFLNGQEVKLPDKSYCDGNRPAELKSLLSMIHEYGMKGLIEPGTTYPLMLRWLEYEDNLIKHNISRFEGELPTLDSGVLRNPELAIALNHEIQSPVTPEAYKPVLCWATDEMRRQFPQQLAPLWPFQAVGRQGSMAQWKDKANDPNCLNFSSIELGIKTSRNSTRFAPFLIDTMAPASAKMGFDDEQGRVLCETTVDFLLQFPVSERSPQNLELAEEFVVNYCPINIVGMQADEVCVRDFGHAKRALHFPHKLHLELINVYNPLFLMLSKDNPLRDRALNMMTREQWLAVTQKTDTQYHTPETLLAIYETFGIDNAGMELKLDYPGFRTLFEGGYRFADETRYFTLERELKIHKDKYPDADLTSFVLSKNDSVMLKNLVLLTDPERVDRMRHVYREMLSTNLWPLEHHVKPASLLEVISIGKNADFDDFHNPKALTVHAHLTLQGVDACVKVATTEEHWATLAMVFSAEELKPYLRQMPGKAKGYLLEQVMGL